ncbi:AraC family transcriptional regulator [Lactobacillus sp. HT06-2]|uniref:helix-turn-helix domain-containing protein n=1 Tax=Lactobacillus sp. HT06-2 TaxID=2080222 RepID=UPI000CD925A5|nr:AraC family transcriptional regulator [Lactobacillus sp. HT06-2]
MKNRHELVTTNFGLPFRMVVHTNSTPEDISLHWHKAIEINCMLDWPLSEINVDGKEYQMKTGRIWCANSMEPHSVHALKNDVTRRAVSIILPYDFVKNIFTEIDQGEICLNNFSKLTTKQQKIYQEELFPKFEELFQIVQEPDKFLRLNLYLKTLEIIKLILTNFFKEEKSIRTINDEQAERMNLIRDYVDQHYRAKIQLEDLMPVVHLSRSYLAKVIRNCFNMTLNEYVNLVRSEKVLADLQAGITKQTELAERNGFSGLRSMNRWLEKYYSAGAKELRQNLEQ